MRVRIGMAFIASLVFLGAFAPRHAAQAIENDPCSINLSQLIAGLVEAQSVASAGRPEESLVILRAGSEFLDRLANECETTLNAGAEATPEATEEALVNLSIPGSFRAPNGAFVFDYPPEWEINDFIAFPQDSGTVTIGNSAEAIEALSSQQPVLVSGQQAVLILGSAPEIVTNGEMDSGATVEAILGYFIGTFRSLYSEIGEIESLEIVGRDAGRVFFGGEGFDAVIYAVELEAGARYVTVVGTGAKGEIEALIDVVEHVAGTLQ